MVSSASNDRVVAEAVDNFSNTLVCPVMAAALRDAVLLVPCGHTISEVAAKNIYGGVDTLLEVNVVKKRGPCPLCRATVLAYYPNLAMRSVVETALGIKVEEVLPQVSAAVQADAEKDLDAIPFPGIAAKFVHSSGNWEPYDSGASLVRKLDFTSQREGSLFEKLELLGYNDGHIALSIDFGADRESAGKYLQDCGIMLDSISASIGFYISRLNDTKLLFKILAKHNEIPASHFELIRDTVEKGTWKGAPPAGESPVNPAV